jgi:hypothetical protein
MHRNTVAQMRANGDPRADCYEACGPTDAVCFKRCDNQHPFAGTILQGSASGGGGGGAPATPSGGSTSTEGTAEAAPQGDKAPDAVDTAQVAKVVTDAVLADQAKRGAHTSSTSPSTSPPPSPSPSRSTGSGSTSVTKKDAPRSEIDCNPACATGKRCVVLLAGSNQCTPGAGKPRCWLVEKTHGECR